MKNDDSLDRVLRAVMEKYRKHARIQLDANDIKYDLLSTRGTKVSSSDEE